MNSTDYFNVPRYPPIQACRNNLVQHLDHLLFYGADMNARNASGNTPLHVCAVNNTDSSCIRQLLFRGGQKDALNYANQTPYQVAVIAGNMELADVIKNYQPDEVGELFLQHDSHRSALSCLCFSHAHLLHTRLVRFFFPSFFSFDHRRSIQAEASFGWLCCFAGVWRRRLRNVQCLDELGINVFVK